MSKMAEGEWWANSETAVSAAAAAILAPAMLLRTVTLLSALPKK
jgi:hypothetical protein